MALVLGSAIVFVFCVAVSFLLSGIEAGVLALSRFRVRQQMRAGSHRAQLLHHYLENPEDFLWTILVGNTVCNVAAFALMGIALLKAFGHQPWGFGVVFAGVVFLFYIGCELLPKMLFRQFPNRLCLALVLPFRLLHLALSRPVGVLTWFSDLILRVTRREKFKGHIFSSRKEVRLALQESAQILTSEERAMVNRVLDLQNLTVRSISVPMHKVIGVKPQTVISEVLEICRQQPLNRLPVWQGEGFTRRTVGIVSLSTLLYAENLDPDQSVGRYARAPLQFQEDLRLEEALRRMQRTRQRMAVVLGFDQREIGIINLRDILKSIFGEVTL
jgi:putative hemolysin